LSKHFDHIANAYDADFTHTHIGMAQRNQVWKQLLPIEKKATCLEVNCGTGEDAKKLCELGLQVEATDVSPEMVSVTTAKIEPLGGKARVLDLTQLKEDDLNRIDLLFSNFGGLNCLSPNDWDRLSMVLQNGLSNTARLSMVIMGRKCLWERFYFSIKGKQPWKRNSHEAVMANVEGISVATWYYSPAEIYAYLKESFKLVKVRPIGLFVPPSYLEPFVKKRKSLFKILSFLDRVFANMGCLSNYADHFYIELQKRKT